MGLRGFEAIVSGRSFGNDVLRIHVNSPSCQDLTIVNLPGLMFVPNESQSEDDVDTIHQIVDSYISKCRAIIFAILQASNDISNQEIVQKASKHDRV